eukprot:TRINITY_DN17166_c0_g1_i2.p1 TRINITY_DN17166_c0_g1~~TRINITY_DN17166_c0_g1_i2.p1  ORF type:complete len:666 (+),score=179.10 TRINITY_DN17166_c0_g1_i2:71-2068(+)
MAPVDPGSAAAPGRAAPPDDEAPAEADATAGQRLLTSPEPPQPDPEPAVSLALLRTLSARFWLMVGICTLGYGTVQTFNNTASSFLMERDLFTDPLPLAECCCWGDPAAGECYASWPGGGAGAGADCRAGCAAQAASAAPPLNLTASDRVRLDCDAGADSGYGLGGALPGVARHCEARADAIARAAVWMSVPYYMNAAVAWALGLIVDRVGHAALLLVVTSVCFCIGDLVLAVTALPAYWPLGLKGLAYAFYAAALWPSVVYVVPSQTVGAAYGVLNSLLNLGMCVFPLIVASVYNASGRRYLPNTQYWWASVGAACAALAVALNIADSRSGGALNRSHWHDAAAAAKRSSGTCSEATEVCSGGDAASVGTPTPRRRKGPRRQQAGEGLRRSPGRPAKDPAPAVELRPLWDEGACAAGSPSGGAGSPRPVRSQPAAGLRTKAQLPLRWPVLLCTCLSLLGNFYCYDNPAALKEHLRGLFHEMDAETFETRFQLLYSVYSFPNIVLPFFGGLLADRIGTRPTYLLFGAVITVAQTVFALGASLRSYGLMLAGRAIHGLGGEILVVVENTFLAEWFRGSELAFAFGLGTSFGRVGSVLNNVVSPAIARRASVHAALWCGAGLNLASLLVIAVLVVLDLRGERILARQQQQQQQQQCAERRDGEDVVI